MLIPLILAVLSLITFALYGVDKLLAKTGARRIPERVLLGFSLLVVCEVLKEAARIKSENDLTV